MNTGIKLVKMRESHYGMVAQTLRAIANDVDEGKFDDVKSAAIVFYGEKPDGTTRVDVFGSGEESTCADTVMAFNAGIIELLRINGLVKT